MSKIRVCWECFRPVKLETWLEWVFGESTWICPEHGRLDSDETVKVPELKANFAPKERTAKR